MVQQRISCYALVHTEKSYNTSEQLVAENVIIIQRANWIGFTHETGSAV